MDFTRLLKQLAALSPGLKIWLVWMVVATMAVPAVNIEHPFFAAVLLCQIGHILFGGWLMLRFGLVKLLSVSHLIFWIPMVAKLVYYHDTLGGADLALAYVVIATVVASLILDMRDFADWLRGDRAPIV